MTRKLRKVHLAVWLALALALPLLIAASVAFRHDPPVSPSVPHHKK